MCGLRTSLLADANPQEFFLDLQTDVDSKYLDPHVSVHEHRSHYHASALSDAFV